jgi:raffinose/stachyose/melibiose transport system permease protein
MKEFDHVYAMTRGGPGQSSTVLALYAYRESISRLNLGYGGTIAIGILLLSALLILPARSLLLGKREA